MQKSILIRDTGISVLDILNLLSRGSTYKQVIALYPQITMADIMSTAQLAKEVIECILVDTSNICLESEIRLNTKVLNITQIRAKHPRAYEKWDAQEDRSLIELFRKGNRIGQLAEILQRQPGAIGSRLKHLGLISQQQKVS